jgi:hypothetical protein
LLRKAARTIGLAVPLAASDPLSGHQSTPARSLERNAEIETRDAELSKENTSKNFNKKTAGSSPPPHPAPPDKELLTGEFLNKNRNNLRNLGNAQNVQAIKPGDGGGGGGGRSDPVERRPSGGITVEALAAVPDALRMTSLLIQGRKEEARIAAGRVAGSMFGARVAPGYWKVPAAMVGSCIGGYLAGGGCDPVQAAKAPVQAAVQTVKKAYSSPQGYLETMWDISPTGITVNFVREIWPW